VTPSQPPTDLSGGQTSLAGFVAIIASGTGLVAEIWKSISTKTPLDITVVSATVTGIISGIGLIKAADAKQKKG
jgi:hypothetical protein